MTHTVEYIKEKAERGRRFANFLRGSYLLVYILSNFLFLYYAIEKGDPELDGKFLWYSAWFGWGISNLGVIWMHFMRQLFLSEDERIVSIYMRRGGSSFMHQKPYLLFAGSLVCLVIFSKFITWNLFTFIIAAMPLTFGVGMAIGGLGPLVSYTGTLFWGRISEGKRLLKIHNRRAKILGYLAGLYGLSYVLPVFIMVRTHPFNNPARDGNPLDWVVTFIQFGMVASWIHLVNKRHFEGNSNISYRIYTFFGGIKTHTFKFAHMFLWLTLASTIYYSALTTEKSLGFIRKILPYINHKCWIMGNPWIFLVFGGALLAISILFIMGYQKWVRKHHDRFLRNPICHASVSRYSRRSLGK